MLRLLEGRWATTAAILLTTLMAAAAAPGLVSAQPVAGDDPATTDPAAAGDPAAGDPAAGDPALGDPAASDPAATDPAATSGMGAPADDGMVTSGEGGFGYEADASATADPDAQAGTGRLDDEQVLVEERLGVEAARDTSDPWEDPEEGYYFLGMFYRHTFVPAFLLDLFLDASTATNNPAFGADITYRKDGFDIVGSLWWASYSAEGPFLASGDPEEDVEFINSELSILFASASFLWSTPFDDIFALEYGVGIGAGLVLGDIVRTEGYPSDGAGSVNGYAPCTSVGDPNATYCDGPSVRDGEEGGHYNVIARKWSDGGSVPNVVPWLAIPHIALRIKPIHQLMMRVEGGFGLGFFMGASAAYGF